MAVRNDLHFIKTEFDENNYSHVFLIETNSLEKCEAELKQEIKKILVSDEVSLSQIDNNEFVDLITVRPEGKSIKKDQIEALQERIKIKPLVSDKMFFIITPADTMNEIASNKLLKTIEEPNDNVIGYLITNNISQILPTIKSRCESLMAFYDDIVQVEENRSEYIDYVNNSEIY